jgi:hypothetical protein
MAAASADTEGHDHDIGMRQSSSSAEG